MTQQISDYSQPIENIPPQFQLTSPAMPARARFPVRISSTNAILMALLAAAALLWATSLESINVREMDDTGLISVLPPGVLFAFLLLCASFGLAVSRRSPSVSLLFGHVVLLIFMAYGITALVYEAPRFAIGWKLSGIMDYIMQTGTVDGGIDAFFNWPGFFILMALMTEAAGFDNPQLFMRWAPVIFNLLYLGPLWMLFRSTTSDLRLVMLGIWFFYLANWIGQDYLAPQALNFFFFLMCLAIILTWLRGPAWQPDTVLMPIRNRLPAGAARVGGLWSGRVGLLLGFDHPPAPDAGQSSRSEATAGQRVAMLILVLFILMAMVPSHQLTPFFTLAAISALVLFNRCTVTTLPVILGIMIAAWVLYMASPYLRGHIEQVTAPMGSVTTNIDANLTDRFRGSPEHIFINYLRSGMSLGVWTLAFMGGLRRLRNGYRDRACALLALTPFPILFLQVYGGEVLLRIYLFSVPFMAFFGACLFFPSPLAGRRWWTAITLWGISFVMLVGFLFTRYGNERMMYFTNEEVAAVQHLYDIAEPGSQFVAATGTLPWRFQEYRTYRYTDRPNLVRTGDVEALAGLMADSQYPASYLILTRSQKASGELYIGWPPGAWEEFEQVLHDSDELTVIYANEDAKIYALSAQCRELIGDERDCTSPTAEGP